MLLLIRMEPVQHLMNGEETRRFLLRLKEETGLDFSGYATSSAARRLLRIRNHFKVPHYDAMLEAMLNDPALRVEFLDMFTVNVTEMFRDPVFYRAFIPYVERAIQRLAGAKPLHLWHPACSSGEEILSLGIALHEKKLLDRMRFIGTDINERMLERATRKLIKKRLLPDYNKAYEQATEDEGGLDRFFQPFGTDELQLRPSIGISVRYDYQDLTDLQWEGKGPFDMIVCRNVMIYFSPGLQDDVLSFLVEKLRLGGILALGHKESITFCRDARRLEALDTDARIFRKIR